MTAREQAVGCEQCGLPYGEPGWVDVVIPNEIWNALNKDLLCFTCMTKALVQAGYKDVPVLVASGPYRDANEEWRLIGWDHGYQEGKRAWRVWCTDTIHKLHALVSRALGVPASMVQAIKEGRWRIGTPTTRR